VAGVVTEVMEEESNLVAHARNEMRRAGLHLEDSDYDGMLYDAVLDLIKVFSGQGHSGYSAMLTVSLFTTLASFEPLGPITDDPSEWMDVAEYTSGHQLWQNRRRSSAFSTDGGKTYTLVDDRSRRARITSWAWFRLPSRVRKNSVHLRRLLFDQPRYKSASAAEAIDVSDR